MFLFTRGFPFKKRGISGLCHDQSVNKDATPPSRTAGSQTLARGLAVLRLVTEAADGLSPAEVAAAADVHRTVAYRILNTLCDAQMLHRGSDGRYRGAAGLLPLAAAGHQHLRTAALPLLREAADELGITVSLLVREADIAVALAVVSPRHGTYHVAFSEGSHHPITQGAAGLALQAAEPERATDSEQIRDVRKLGYAQTFGQVEENMHGLAVPLKLGAGQPFACLNAITVREQHAADSAKTLQRIGAELSRIIRI